MAYHDSSDDTYCVSTKNKFAKKRLNEPMASANSDKLVLY